MLKFALNHGLRALAMQAVFTMLVTKNNIVAEIKHQGRKIILC